MHAHTHTYTHTLSLISALIGSHRFPPLPPSLALPWTAERSSSAGFLLEDVYAFPDAHGPVKLVFGCEQDETGEIFRQVRSSHSSRAGERGHEWKEREGRGGMSRGWWRLVVVIWKALAPFAS